MASKGNYFGDGSDGDLVLSSPLVIPSTLDGDIIVKNYNNLIINSGGSITTSTRCKGLCINVKHKCELNTSNAIVMTAKGARINPSLAGVDASGITFIRRAPGYYNTATSSTVDGCGTALISSENHQPAVLRGGLAVNIPQYTSNNGGSGGSSNKVIDPNFTPVYVTMSSTSNVCQDSSYPTSWSVYPSCSQFISAAAGEYKITYTSGYYRIHSTATYDWSWNWSGHNMFLANNIVLPGGGPMWNLNPTSQNSSYVESYFQGKFVTVQPSTGPSGFGLYFWVNDYPISDNTGSIVFKVEKLIANTTIFGGSGASGTCFSGGAGGGGATNTTEGNDGSLDGGSGGAAGQSGTISAGGGAGNDGGLGYSVSVNNTGSSGNNGTGGLIILNVGGGLDITAPNAIVSRGSNGGSISSSSAMYEIGGPGGGSGGGHIVIFYAGEYTNTVSEGSTIFDNNGGLGGTYPTASTSRLIFSSIDLGDGHDCSPSLIETRTITIPGSADTLVHISGEVDDNFYIQCSGFTGYIKDTCADAGSFSGISFTVHPNETISVSLYDMHGGSTHGYIDFQFINNTIITSNPGSPGTLYGPYKVYPSSFDFQPIKIFRQGLANISGKIKGVLFYDSMKYKETSLIAGGNTNSGAISSLERYLYNNETSSILSNTLSTSRYGYHTFNNDKFIYYSNGRNTLAVSNYELLVKSILMRKATTTYTTSSSTIYSTSITDSEDVGYIFGGENITGTANDDVSKLNLTTGLLSYNIAQLTSSISGASSITDWPIYNYTWIIGGSSTNIIQKYDLTTSTTASTNVMTLLSNNKWSASASNSTKGYIIGGYNGTNSSTVVQNYTLSNDTGTTSYRAQLPIALHGLGNSQSIDRNMVYLYGGISNTDIQKLIQKYDLTTDTIKASVRSLLNRDKYFITGEVI